MTPMTSFDWHRSAQTMLTLAAQRRKQVLNTPKALRGPYWKRFYKQDLVAARIRRLAKQDVLSEVKAFGLLDNLLHFEKFDDVCAEVL